MRRELCEAFADINDVDINDVDIAAEGLRMRVIIALQEAGHSPLREIQISVRQGQVGLVGTVPTYHLKQLAQAVVLGVEGVAAVENGLSVPPEAGPEAPEPDLPA